MWEGPAKTTHTHLTDHTTWDDDDVRMWFKRPQSDSEDGVANNNERGRGPHPVLSGGLRHLQSAPTIYLTKKLDEIRDDRASAGVGTHSYPDHHHSEGGHTTETNNNEIRFHRHFNPHTHTHTVTKSVIDQCLAWYAMPSPLTPHIRCVWTTSAHICLIRHAVSPRSQIMTQPLFDSKASSIPAVIRERRNLGINSWKPLNPKRRKTSQLPGCG